MRRCKKKQTEGTSITIRIDVTKIVRYLCMAGVLIVGIIFGTRCYLEITKNIEE